MYQGALVLVLAGPFCYFSLLSKSIPLFRGRNVKNYEWKPVKERWQIAVGLERVGGGGGEMTLHVLAYYPRGSKNKRKIGGFSPSTSGRIGLLVCSLT